MLHAMAVRDEELGNAHELMASLHLLQLALRPAGPGRQFKYSFMDAGRDLTGGLEDDSEASRAQRTKDALAQHLWYSGTVLPGEEQATAFLRYCFDADEATRRGSARWLATSSLGEAPAATGRTAGTNFDGGNDDGAEL